ncbi:MAG: peptide deformylase [Planctomycetes bacterium]|nr:peptide deformylase [Planctomycetota bacterium]MBU1517412.1 peptide deformylase [Planctomycetota bacterium]MBU2457772.1 peptide deformylase [Planctomycetota bacterium]MBU2596997.1 peptide deformylase [Planctomycetota bacterium]
MVDVEKCRMTRWPTPVLVQKAQPIEDIDDSIQALAEKMKDIMVEYKGVGLAGPQAGVGLRIFVASLDGTKENAKVYINPVITPSGTLVVNEEGCLSLPGIWGNIKRYSKCSIKAQGLDGKEFTEQAEGLLVRIFQHECDHLDGTLVADKLSTVAKIAARRKLRQLREDYENQNK